jgi:hypothetical protein
MLKNCSKIKKSFFKLVTLGFNLKLNKTWV